MLQVFTNQTSDGDSTVSTCTGLTNLVIEGTLGSAHIEVYASIDGRTPAALAGVIRNGDPKLHTLLFSSDNYDVRLKLVKANAETNISAWLSGSA